MLSRLLSRNDPTPSQSPHLGSLLIVALFHIPLTLVFASIAFKSTGWETVLDGPMFMYSGFLMDHFGMAPVRDFFTYNMIGTHVAYRWLYHFYGGTLLGMRLADLTLLAIVMVLFVIVLRPFGFRVAWAGALIFGLLHLTHGLHCYLQRDFFALIPIQLAILSATQWFGSRPRLRWIATGLFVGTLATIKPHLTIGGLVLYGYLAIEAGGGAPSWRAWTVRAARVAVWCSVGGGIPIVWMAGYLAYYGQLGAFAHVLATYFPLHDDISGKQRVFTEGEALPFVIEGFFGPTAWQGKYQLALGAGTGLALLVAVPTMPGGLRRYGALLACLGVAYLVYPVFAKRFYDYHYYPFFLLATVWLAFCFYRWSADTPIRIRVMALGVAAYAFAGMYYAEYNDLDKQPTQATGGYHRTARMVQWLRSRLGPEDTVQGIEWASCGVAQALLEMKVKVATHTIWGEVLYHHVSNPFVTGLRKDFMDQLEQAPPRFVIVSKMDDDYVSGSDCSRSFPEFEAFLAAGYFVALDSNDFEIWESNTSSTAELDRIRRAEVGSQKGETAPDRLGAR